MTKQIRVKRPDSAVEIGTYMGDKDGFVVYETLLGVVKRALPEDCEEVIVARSGE